MLHIVAGYPDLKKSEKLARLMAMPGADFIEIQIPFSDPVADGPTIMRANEIALKNGIKVEDCFTLMQRLNRRFSSEKFIKIKEISAKQKFLFMTYFNILFRYGVEKFCKRARECGCYGLIVPDMPIDEESFEGYFKACKKYELKAIQIVSPLTSEERLKKIARYAEGFVYAVSRYGVTGQSSKLNPELKKYLSKVKKYIKLPLAVGFGISDKEEVQEVWRFADIAVIGSKLIDLVNNGGVKRVKYFLKEILGTC